MFSETKKWEVYTVGYLTVTWSGKTMCAEALLVGSCRKPGRAPLAPPMLSAMRGRRSSDTALSSYCTYSTSDPSAEPHVADGVFVTSSVRETFQLYNYVYFRRAETRFTELKLKTTAWGIWHVQEIKIRISHNISFVLGTCGRLRSSFSEGCKERPFTRDETWVHLARPGFRYYYCWRQCF